MIEGEVLPEVPSSRTLLSTASLCETENSDTISVIMTDHDKVNKNASDSIKVISGTGTDARRSSIRSGTPAPVDLTDHVEVIPSHYGSCDKHGSQTLCLLGNTENHLSKHTARSQLLQLSVL